MVVNRNQLQNAALLRRRLSCCWLRPRPRRPYKPEAPSPASLVMWGSRAAILQGRGVCIGSWCQPEDWLQ